MDYKKTVLGIELGSTRIKAVLIDENHIPIAGGPGTLARADKHYLRKHGANAYYGQKQR